MTIIYIIQLYFHCSFRLTKTHQIGMYVVVSMSISKIFKCEYLRNIGFSMSIFLQLYKL